MGPQIRHVPVRVIATLVAVGAVGSAAASASSARRIPPVEAVQRALPALVSIGREQFANVVPADPLQQFRYDRVGRIFRDLTDRPPPPACPAHHSSGSGVTMDSLGCILTNFHMIERTAVIRATPVDVRPCTAQLIAGGELNARALTRIEPARSLAKIAFERDDDLMLGDPVIVLGNLHELAHTVTGGVLSAGNREVRDGDGVLFRNLLQTDAAVNLGHSVGPLINADGELIGINVAILPESHNIGFGVPLGRVRAVRSIEEVGTPFDAVSPGLTAWRSVAEFERGTEYLPGRTQTAPATLN